MRVDLLVGVAALTMALLPPAPGAPPPAEGLPPGAEPPPVSAPPAATVDTAIAAVADDEPVVTTTTVPAVTTTTAAPFPPQPPPTTPPPPPTTIAATPTSTEAPPTSLPPTPEPEPEPEPVAPAAAEEPAVEEEAPSLGGGWEDLRQCESGGNYSAVSPGGAYRGAYQFHQPTWDGVVARMGRSDLVGVDPASASAGAQDAAAEQLYSERGAQPWPHCGRYL